MLSAALSAATPTALDGERLTVAFPADAAFVKKKAEATGTWCSVLRGLTGHSLLIAYELREDASPPGPSMLGDELIDRLRAEFAAEEVFEEEER